MVHLNRKYDVTRVVILRCDHQENRLLAKNCVCVQECVFPQYSSVDCQVEERNFVAKNYIALNLVIRASSRSGE